MIFFLLDSEMVNRMVERLEKLLNFVPVQRALALTSNNVYKEEILRLVELRVVRECNLPDNYTNFLRVSLKPSFQDIKNVFPAKKCVPGQIQENYSRKSFFYNSSLPNSTPLGY